MAAAAPVPAHRSPLPRKRFPHTVSLILAPQRDKDVVGALKRYREYIQSVRESLPEAVLALATSDWYYTLHDHRCPHDAWLESVTISEPSSGNRHEIRSTSIRVRLLGACHDGFIEFFYPRVFGYSLDVVDAAGGHRDWRYDEFRLSERGNVVHEIEWCGLHGTGRWIIEASDVHFAWIPKENA